MPYFSYTFYCFVQENNGNTRTAHKVDPDHFKL